MLDNTYKRLVALHGNHMRRQRKKQKTEQPTRMEPLRETAPGSAGRQKEQPAAGTAARAAVSKAKSAAAALKSKGDEGSMRPNPHHRTQLQDLPLEVLAMIITPCDSLHILHASKAMHQVGKNCPWLLASWLVSHRPNKAFKLASQAGEQVFLHLLSAEHQHRVCPTAADLDGMRPLHYACAAGFAEATDVLLKVPGAPATAVDKYGRTAVHYASSRGHTEVLRKLLQLPELAARAGAADKAGMTALHCACSQGHTQAAQQLMGEAGVDVLTETNRGWIAMQDSDTEGSDGSTALHLACRHGHLEVVRLLLQHPRAEEMCRKFDSHWSHPMHHAARLGHVQIVRRLHAVYSLSSAWGLNLDGMSPFMLACEGGHMEIAHLLLVPTCFESSIYYTDRQQRTVLHMACKAATAEALVPMLLGNGAAAFADKRDAAGSTALHIACTAGHVGATQALLAVPGAVPAAGAKAPLVELFALGLAGVLNVRDGASRTPLICASKAGYAAIVRVLLAARGMSSDDHSIISAGASAVGGVNAADAEGMTALHWACQGGHAKAVQELLAASHIDVSKVDGNGRSAMFLACKGGHATVVQQMIDRDAASAAAAALAVAADDKSAVHAAAEREGEGGMHTMRLLLQLPAVREAVVEYVQGSIKSPLCALQGLSAVRSVAAAALHASILDQNEGVIRQLMESPHVGSKVLCSTADAEGNTALHLAAREGCSEAVQLVLGGRGASNALAATNASGRTALHEAVAAGHSEVVAQLLLAGLQQQGNSALSVADDTGATPLQLAKDGSNKQVVRLLQLVTGMRE
ncbi:ankyrin repeat-containing domain protein [Dunaliella salina]|uniref:Ankyrin repeat-containing domain protein n=1 Tax=Dunaliella salina TaxID=3046 RepID=A0ABQ7H6G9_DUNSA|nr:ankyrin repeat-containing domain protein [Dunaliella salina]|eukprot:KAF5842457.1 ankyrin repeat-containing domain protein [Dunaliella salina]